MKKRKKFSSKSQLRKMALHILKLEKKKEKNMFSTFQRLLEGGKEISLKE